MDVVIGHSKPNNQVLHDAIVLILEVKKKDTLDKALPQVIAQAAANLHFRRKAKRGMDKTGGPIHFIRTNGITWIFSKMSSDENDGLIVQHSAEMSILQDGEFNLEQTLKIFNWLVNVIEQSRDSSPRSLVVNVNQEATGLAESFSELKIEHE